MRAKVARNEVAKTLLSRSDRQGLGLPFAILSVLVLPLGFCPAVKLAMNQATTPSFKVVLPDGKPRPGPRGMGLAVSARQGVSNGARCSEGKPPKARRFDFNWLNRDRNGLLLWQQFLLAFFSGLGPGKTPPNIWPNSCPIAVRHSRDDLHARPGLPSRATPAWTPF